MSHYHVRPCSTLILLLLLTTCRIHAKLMTKWPTTFTGNVRAPHSFFIIDVTVMFMVANMKY